MAKHQIICKNKVMEAAAKEYTGMIAKIIDNRLWMGAMGRSDVRFLETPKKLKTKLMLNRGGD